MDHHIKLRRVTFSGRLSQPSEGEEWRTLIRVIVCMILDIGLVLGSGVSFYYLLQGYFIFPTERGFYCNDAVINKPWLPNTISTSHLLCVSLVLPFFIIFLCEAVLFYQGTGEHRLVKFFSSSTFVYLEYILVYVVCFIILEMIKCGVGRLRPHFLDVCQVDWSKVDCNTDPNAYIQDFECTQVNSKRIRSARTSFPSGHTTSAVFFWAWLCLYLRGITRASGGQLMSIIRYILLIVFTTWTVVCCITRVTDNWHHPTDVLGGIILSLLFVLPYFGRGRLSSDSVYSTRSILPPRVHFD